MSFIRNISILIALLLSISLSISITLCLSVSLSLSLSLSLYHCLSCLVYISFLCILFLVLNLSLILESLTSSPHYPGPGGNRSIGAVEDDNHCGQTGSLEGEGTLRKVTFPPFTTLLLFFKLVLVLLPTRA